MEDTLTAVLSSPSQIAAENISADGFDQIIREHQRRVYRVIFLLVKDREAADTLTQECFLRAYQKHSSFRGECSMSTWLLRIGVNLARDHQKNRRASFWRRLVGMNEEDAKDGNGFRPTSLHPSPEQIFLTRELLQEVWTVAADLPQQQRSIFLLRFAEEMSLAEIAEVLNLKTGTVKTQLFRAVSKVKQKVKGPSCTSSIA